MRDLSLWFHGCVAQHRAGIGPINLFSRSKQEALFWLPPVRKAPQQALGSRARPIIERRKRKQPHRAGLLNDGFEGKPRRAAADKAGGPTPGAPPLRRPVPPLGGFWRKYSPFAAALGLALPAGGSGR